MDDDLKMQARFDGLKLAQEYFDKRSGWPTFEELLKRAKVYSDFIIGDEDNAV